MICKQNDFGILIGVIENDKVEALEEVDWGSIIEKINAGKMDNEIIYVLNTHEIPSIYNAVEIKIKASDNYKIYIQEKLNDYSEGVEREHLFDRSEE